MKVLQGANFYSPSQLIISISNLQWQIVTWNTQQNWHSKSDDCCSDICSLNLHKYLEGKSSSPNQHKYLEGKLSIPNQHKNSEGKLCSPFALTKSQGKLCKTSIIYTSKGENRGVEVLVFCDLTFLFTSICRCELTI